MRGGILALILAAVGALGGCAGDRSAERPPNVVIIFTDDQGYGDVGAYGAKGYETPNLDSMAAEGTRFTQFYVGSSVCSPSRAALLTGSYPPRVGIPEVLFPRSTVGLNPEEETIADLLGEVGYATRAIGKWHLGDHPRFLPTNHGFDGYFGIPYSNDMSPVEAHNPGPGGDDAPPLPLLEDTTVVEREPDQRLLTRRYTERAVSFIEERAGEGPFFLYLAHNMPHVPLYASDRFRGKTGAGIYGDVIREIDWSVGEVIRALEREGVGEHTLVLFLSDNGPSLSYGDHAGSSGPLRGGKFMVFEGGHRVPFIARWPGRVPAGRTSDRLVTAMDVLPTVTGLADAPTPENPIDGVDVSPVLLGEADETYSHPPFFFYAPFFLHDGRALAGVRSGPWKLLLPHEYPSVRVEGAEIGSGGVNGTYGTARIDTALFHLASDPGEETNLAEKRPALVDSLAGLIEAQRPVLGDSRTGVEGRENRPPGRVEAPWSVQSPAGL